ncbi:unnamed protein product, partial [Ectocarpus sp. 12 AP-2014]
GGGTDKGLFSSTPPRSVRQDTGRPGLLRLSSAGSVSRRQVSNPAPRSPLLAARPGSLKRPWSGSATPVAKRQGLLTLSPTDRSVRAGTPTPSLRASSPSPKLRSTHLPFTPRSSPRPGSSSRPQNNGDSSSSSSTPRRPSTPTLGRQATSIPSSLEAAGLFSRRPYASRGPR